MKQENTLNYKLTKPLPFFRNLNKSIKHGDIPWQIIIVTATILLIVLIFSIGLMLWTGSRNAQTTFGWKFLLPVLQANWDPVSLEFQAWPFIYGTLTTSLVAIIFAVPIGMGIAIFLSELCPTWLEPILSWMVELLAAIPSVVYGLWGIFVFLPLVVAPLGAFLAATLGRVPLVGIFFYRTSSRKWFEPPGSFIDPDHHDHTYHCSSHPRCFQSYSWFST